LSDPPARCCGIAHDKKPRDAAAVPTSFAGDLRSEASLAIEPVERRLRVRHERLDLDDEHDACKPMEGEDVDRPTFAPEGE
jgi:hypothetical protein